MQNETTFQIALIISLVSMFAPRIYYRIRTRTFGKESFPQDNRVLLNILLFSLALTFLAMLVWLINSDWMVWSAVSLPAWIRWAGFVLALAAAALLTWTHHVLGKNYSPKLEIREQHRLITTGPYRWVRHPMYGAIFFWTAGVALITANWTMFFFPLTFISFIILRMPREEQMMIETYGDDYRNHMNKTGRFLPRLKQKNVK